MTATSVGGALSAARQRLAAAGIEQAGLEARLLLAEVIGGDIAMLIGHPERPLAQSESERLETVLCRRLRREPLAYILGRREFWSLPLAVDQHTLIPRPDSETLVEVALSLAADRADLRVVDLGTGSGCLLLALLNERPDAWGVGMDIDEGAIRLARDNARMLGLEGRAMFVRGDWAQALCGAFDLVVANPPYIADDEWAELDAGVRDYEPARALRAGADGLDAYRRILPQLPLLLAPGGLAVVEVGGHAATVLPPLVQQAGLEIIEMRLDLSGRRRCLAISAAAGKRREKISWKPNGSRLVS